MKFLKSLAVIAGLALVTFNVSAQQRQPMDAQTMTNNIKEKIAGITPDQESKILAANQEFVKGMQDARAGGDGDRDAMRAKMQPLREARDAKFKTILSADQYAQFQKMEADRMGKRGGN
jgi:hypothetical protein